MTATHETGYPQARQLDLTEEIFGHQVSDPYRWMEDAGSAELANWLRDQARLFSAQREGWPGRDDLAARVRDLLNVGVVGTPAWRGERSFFIKREPGQEHAVLCTQVADGFGAPVEVLVDPMAIDPSGLTTLDAWQPDKEGRLLAYQLSEGGDEESLLRVLDVEHRFGGGRADRPVPVLQRGLAAGRQGLLLHAAAAAVRGAVRGEPVSPSGLPAPGRHAGGGGRAHLRYGPGQDRLLLRLGQPGRPLAFPVRVAGHGAAQRPVAG